MSCGVLWGIECGVNTEDLLVLYNPLYQDGWLRVTVCSSGQCLIRKRYSGDWNSIICDSSTSLPLCRSHCSLAQPLCLLYHYHEILACQYNFLGRSPTESAWLAKVVQPDTLGIKQNEVPRSIFDDETWHVSINLVSTWPLWSIVGEI